MESLSRPDFGIWNNWMMLALSLMWFAALILKAIPTVPAGQDLRSNLSEMTRTVMSCETDRLATSRVAIGRGTGAAIAGFTA